ncbi:2-phospho-L-lactate guanylyltransferase [Phytohabitans houttuyneae]|uniref:2-phospho-L-lactate guanylyltransferase n=1 Tax=Phytohabitans houttuyneae TaxID=1076126 RepID=UPI0031E61E30
MERTWGVVLPVKRLTAAKSRLRGALTGVPHERLALALAQDTVAAALASAEVAEVLAVTDDPAVGQALAALGARVVPDVPGGGLNAAFAYGASLLAHRPVAALAADLPTLCPADLSEALREAAGPGRHFVADAPGTGTVLLTAQAGVRLDPRFGPGSAAAHRRSGAVPLAGDWPSLRRDVDTAADLEAATRLGLGPHSAEVAGQIGSASCSHT